MTDLATTELTTDEAQSLERAFLSGLNEAQDAYEQIVAGEAWKQLGHETFADWWVSSVQPVMTALSMRPTREIAAAVLDQVRAEEADLPSTQRRTQRELADMVGVDRRTASGWKPSQDHPQVQDVPRGDLEGPDEAPPASSVDEPEGPSAPSSGSGTPAPKSPREPDPPAEPAWSSEQIDLRKRLENGETVVVSLRAHHADIVRWATDRDLLVRVDRRTEWGNPFEMPADGDRGTVVAHYQWHYLPHKPSLMGRVQELKGKALGCWCAPEECHADVLAELAEGGETS